MSGWWKGSVTYQIYPRSFQDSTGDGVGDLRGITRRLDHVADLGVDAIWLSPVFPSPMADMGYDVSDYRGIDPVFGTLNDFDALVARAHDLGLKLIIDQVISHSAAAHPFFAQSRASRSNPRADWYVWADPKADGTPPNNWLSVFGGPAWTWDAGRRQYYFHNFLASQPDFNFHNPEVQDYHLDTLRFWLDRGVDGFRLDTVNFFFHDKRLRDDAANPRVKPEPDTNPYEMQLHLFSKSQPETLAFLERMRALTDRYDARMMVGEVGDSDFGLQLMGDYTTGARLHQAYSFGMLGKEFSPEHFAGKVRDFFAQAPEGWPCWAFSNHDVTRHVGRWAEFGETREALAKLSAALLLSLEGSVCLYQGEELGQTDTALELHELTDPQGIAFWPAPVGRDGCRTPMVWERDAPQAGFTTGTPWLPVKPEQAARAVDTQGEGSVRAFYREMLALRRATPDLRLGRSRFLDAPEGVLAFRRGETTLCLFNLSREPRRFEAEGELLLAQSAGQSGGQVAFGPNGFALLQVAPRGA